MLHQILGNFLRLFFGFGGCGYLNVGFHSFSSPSLISPTWQELKVTTTTESVSNDIIINFVRNLQLASRQRKSRDERTFVYVATTRMQRNAACGRFISFVHSYIIIAAACGKLKESALPLPGILHFSSAILKNDFRQAMAFIAQKQARPFFEPDEAVNLHAHRSR